MALRPTLMIDVWNQFTPDEKVLMALVLPSGSVGALALTKLTTVRNAVLIKSVCHYELFIKLTNFNQLWEVP